MDLPAPGQMGGGEVLRSAAADSGWLRQFICLLVDWWIGLGFATRLVVRTLLSAQAESRNLFVSPTVGYCPPAAAPRFAVFPVRKGCSAPALRRFLAALRPKAKPHRRQAGHAYGRQESQGRPIYISLRSSHLGLRDSISATFFLRGRGPFQAVFQLRQNLALVGEGFHPLPDQCPSCLPPCRHATPPHPLVILSGGKAFIAATPRLAMARGARGPFQAVFQLRQAQGEFRPSPTETIRVDEWVESHGDTGTPSAQGSGGG